MHGPTCIFWANLTPFSLQFTIGDCPTDDAASGEANSGGPGGRPAPPLALGLHRIPTHFPLNLYGI
jgi:hypothetical protein